MKQLSQDIQSPGRHLKSERTEYEAGVLTIRPQISVTANHLFVRFQVLTAASMMFRIVFWDVLPCKIIVDNHFTRQYIPEDNSENHLFVRITTN
jgi:hypothetical protein